MIYQGSTRDDFWTVRYGCSVASHTLIPLGLGPSLAAGTCLASVLKEGKESLLQKQQQKQKQASPISLQCHLEARTEDINAKGMEREGEGQAGLGGRRSIRFAAIGRESGSHGCRSSRHGVESKRKLRRMPVCFKDYQSRE